MSLWAPHSMSKTATLLRKSHVSHTFGHYLLLIPRTDWWKWDQLVKQKLALSLTFLSSTPWYSIILALLLMQLRSLKKTQRYLIPEGPINYKGLSRDEKDSFWSRDKDAYITTRARLKAGIKKAKRRHQQRLESNINTNSTRICGRQYKSHMLQMQESPHHVWGYVAEWA